MAKTTKTDAGWSSSITDRFTSEPKGIKWVKEPKGKKKTKKATKKK